jgi:hypothetical protein
MPETPFADFGLKWFEDIISQIGRWFREQLKTAYTELTQSFFSTPTPEGGGLEAVFGAPASGDEPWHTIYESVVGGEIMLLALLTLFLAVQGRHFVRIFRLGSAYADRRTRRSAWTGAVAVVGWYWLAVLLLYLVEGLTVGLLPDVTGVGAALVDLLPATVGNPLLTMLLASLGGLTMVLLKAVYFLRDVLLYVYLYTMPLGLAVAFGNVPVVSAIARRFARGFVPLAVLPLPAVLLFRGYGLLFADAGFATPTDALLRYVVVISLPVLALYLTWKTFRYASPLVAGAIGRGVRAAALVGTVAGVGYAAGPRAASTAARFGPKAGVGHAAVRRFVGGGSDGGDGTARDDQSNDGGSGGGGGRPEYRRTENDPAYY